MTTAPKAAASPKTVNAVVIRSASLKTSAGLRRGIEELKPLVKWGMKINSRRYLPLAAKLERLEQQEYENRTSDQS